MKDSSSPKLGSKQPGKGNLDAKVNAVVNVAKAPQVAFASLFGNLLAGPQTAAPTDKDGNPVTPSNNNVSVAGAVGVVVVDHTVQANVGTDSADTQPTVLQTAGAIDVESNITEKTQISVTATSSQKTDTSGNNVSVALAIDVNVYTNEADATIGGNAEIDAGKTFTDNASVTYLSCSISPPPLSPPYSPPTRSAAPPACWTARSACRQMR